MTAIASSSTSKAFPFSQGGNRFDEFISDIPQFYTSTRIHGETTSSSKSPTSFKTIDTYLNDDPELFIGDDCDSFYQDTLLNSGLLHYLDSDMDGFTKTNKDVHVKLFASTPYIAHQRLEMLLSHLSQSLTIQQQADIIRSSDNGVNEITTTIIKNKGKGKN